MTKTIKNKPKDFSIDKEKWEIEYKKSLAGLQFASDGKIDDHVHLTAMSKLWLLQLEEYPVESAELLECFSSFLCIDKTCLYNYTYFAQKIIDFDKYADALRIRFEQIWLHYRLLSKVCLEIINDKVFVYDGTYCFEQKKSHLKITILPLPFANIAKNKEDSFSLEIFKKTSHVDYIHDERLGVFQLKHLLSFVVSADKETREKTEKTAKSEMKSLTKQLIIIFGS